MNVIIGSARVDEKGKYSGGLKGDQKQTSAPDYKGEVSMQKFYVHTKGWVIIRPKSKVTAQKLAEAMETACSNINIGYSQSDRLRILQDGTGASKLTNCDCSSLVRQCVIESARIDPGNFNTANEIACLMNTGLFAKLVYTEGTTLFTGDILVTQTKGHTAIVVKGASLHETIKYKANQFYRVACDRLNVRTKRVSENISVIPKARIVAVKKKDDLVFCKGTMTHEGKTWMYLGSDSDRLELWICADNGEQSYLVK